MDPSFRPNIQVPLCPAILIPNYTTTTKQPITSISSNLPKLRTCVRLHINNDATTRQNFDRNRHLRRAIAHTTTMFTISLLLALLAPPTTALLRFSCSQLVVERLDPLVNPGLTQSPHVHQIIGGNAFNASMDPTVAPPDTATCTTCTFAEDFSNYWTATLYFWAKNGTFKRVPQEGNVNFEASNGGMTVYYIPKNVNGATPGVVTAFKKGFRMVVGVSSRLSPRPTSGCCLWLCPGLDIADWLAGYTSFL